MTKINTYTLCILIALMSLTYMPIDIYLPSTYAIAAELGSSIEAVQVGIFIFMISMGLGQLFIGPASDRYGRKPIVIFSLIVYLLASIIATIAPNMELLSFSRILQGIGASGCAITAMAVVRDLFDEKDSALIYSLLNGTQSLVPALAPILGSYIANLYGWRYCFALLILLSLITLIVTNFSLKETNQNRNKKHKNVSLSYIQMLKNKQFLRYSLASMAAMAFIVQYVVKSPLLLIEHLGLTTNQFALMFGANAIVIIFASYLATRLIKRTSPTTSVITGLCLLLVSSALFFIQPTPSSIIEYVIVICIGSFGFSFCLGSAIGMSLSPFPHSAGKASAFLGFLQFTVTSIIGVGLSTLFPEGGKSLAICVTGLSTISLLMVFWELKVKKRDMALSLQ